MRLIFGTLGLISSIFFASYGLASDVCSTPEIQQTNRPLSTKSTDTFKYSFRLLQGTNNQLPTVIYLPGGPGQASIAPSDPRLSTEYNYIQTDPRGAGCNINYLKKGKKEDINTEVIASDIIAIIESLNLDNYILYGTSFGTALATVVASEAERLGLPKPKSLVLQGVIGRTFRGAEGQEGYVAEWHKSKNEITAEHLSKFKTNSLPLGFSSREW